MAAISTEGVSLFGDVGDLPPENVIFGHSPAMQAVRRKVQRVRATNVPILICGESGTGKEIMAKVIHQQSPWGDGPFVKVHCPAIPGSLLESELFGYEKGAFTGANGSKLGRVELADRGTLFLDEIAELDPALQAKLLQLLQDGQFSRIGATQDKRVEVRVVCATNRQVEAEIKAGRFRQDLFYRINVVSIYLPPLRERREDIPEIVEFLLDRFRKSFDCPVQPISARLIGHLQRYDWPGNVRELENLVKRYVILGTEETVAGELPDEMQSLSDLDLAPGAPVFLKRLTRKAVQELEKKVIAQALQASNWNRKEAARVLNISYRALLYKIKEAGLPRKRVPMVARPVEIGLED